MAVQAYVLVNLEASNLTHTMKAIRTIRQVKSADAVIGPYDCIVYIEADTMDALGKIVVDKLLKVEGVAKTLTCVKI